MQEPANAIPMPKGKCYICGKSLSKDEISDHLEFCRENRAPRPSGKREYHKEDVFHLAVEGADLPQYWLHLEAPAGMTLADLDALLRRVWLECCGHLSQFIIEGKEYAAKDLWEDEEDEEIEEEFAGGDESMDIPLGEVLRPGMIFTHEYDMGNTTELQLRVVSERALDIPGQFIRIVARNDRPDIKCDSCGTPATQVCSECYFEGTGWLCEGCAPEHECDETSLLPVLNSPRGGTCGYGREWCEEGQIEKWEE